MARVLSDPVCRSRLRRKVRGIVKRTMTGADGAYQFDSVPGDMYSVDFEILGFDLIVAITSVRQDATANVDATLPVSAICECVRVTEPTELRRTFRTGRRRSRAATRACAS